MCISVSSQGLQLSIKDSSLFGPYCSWQGNDQFNSAQYVPDLKICFACLYGVLVLRWEDTAVGRFNQMRQGKVSWWWSGGKSVLDFAVKMDVSEPRQSAQ